MLFFFFKQKTAYEMRISDWSSDVCSSDLRLWKISLARNGVQKEIFATDEHRWFTKGRKSTVFTKDLVPGKWLESVTPRKRNDWEMDPAGVRHGIIFGDGSIERGDYGRINLIGEKCELSRFFPEQRQREKEINGLPALYKIGRAHV